MAVQTFPKGIKVTGVVCLFLSWSGSNFCSDESVVSVHPALCQSVVSLHVNLTSEHSI